MGFPITNEFDIPDAASSGSDVSGSPVAELDAARRSDREPSEPSEPRDLVAPVRLGIGRWSRWVAVAGGFGYVPVAPGTAGSLAGVLVFLAVLALCSGGSSGQFLTTYATAVGVLLLLGIRAAGRAEVDFGRRDDGRIVIDEVVGQLVALAPVALWVAPHSLPGLSTGIFANGDAWLLFFEVVTAFVLFRLFDVWKPGAIRWAEQRFEGGLGVMADDVVAGLHAAIGVWLVHALVFERFYSTSIATSTALSEAAALSQAAALFQAAALGIGGLA